MIPFGPSQLAGLNGQDPLGGLNASSATASASTTNNISTGSFNVGGGGNSVVLWALVALVVFATIRKG